MTDKAISTAAGLKQKSKSLRGLFAKRIRFTTSGKLYTAITLGVGFAAVNTGNNPLFIVLGMMLGFIIVSGIMSEISLKALTVKRKLASIVEVDVFFPVELSVSNNKRYTSSYCVELRDEIDGKAFKRRCFFLKVAPTEERRVSYRCEIAKRGRIKFNSVIISTKFPFGLFEKSRRFNLESETIALPKTVNCALPKSAGRVGENGLSQIRHSGLGQEYRELKEMEKGDDPRLIDWKSTAKLGRMMVRQNDREGNPYVEIVLDPSSDGNNDSEENIAKAASLIRLGCKHHIPVRLITANSVFECVEQSDYLAPLIHLALIDSNNSSSSNGIPPLGTSYNSVLIGPKAQVIQSSNTHFHRILGSRLSGPYATTKL